MNILESTFCYFKDILSENVGPKSLIMDDETIKVMALAITRTETLSYEVLYTETLTDLIEKPHNAMLRSLRCICVLRPTPQSVELLCNELSEPHFAKYSLYFANCIPEDLIRKIASFDRIQLVDKVEEIFVDFFPVNSRMFHVGVQSFANTVINLTNETFNRISDSLFSALCSHSSALE